MAQSKQDMPPPSGYAPIVYQRIQMKAGLNMPTKVALTFLMSGVGIYLLNKTKVKLSNEGIEMKCARSALEPMLLAEVDRMYLKQARRNRDEEERIMKDVDGWEVGKFHGKPVYLSFKPDEYYPLSAEEFYVHANEAMRFFSYNISKVI